MTGMKIVSHHKMILANADPIYLGGHEYYITAQEKNDLEAVGYEVFTV